MEKTLEQAFCPPLCLLFEAFLLAWENNHKHPTLNFSWAYDRANIQISRRGGQNTAQTEKTIPKTAFHLFYFLLPIGATEGRNSLTMSEWWNVDSQQRCDAGVGFMSGLISHAPIIACGGHRSPLHGRGGAALIRGEADWIPRSWKIETRGATTESEWPLTSDTLSNRARCVCLVGAISEFDAFL